MHYHLVDVKNKQDKIISEGRRGTLDDLLTIPLAKEQNYVILKQAYLD